MYRFALSFFLLIGGSLFPENLPAQTGTNGQPIKVFGPMRVREKAYIPGNDPQELYIYTDWHTGTFESTKGHRIENYQLRYDILNELLEIKVGAQIKILPWEQLSRFSWLVDDQYLEQYINGGRLLVNNEIGYGVYELILDGRIKLMAKNSPRLIKAYYIPQLDVGHREDRFVRRYDFYLAHRNKLTKIPSKQKDGHKVFGNYSAQIKKYTRRYQLSFNQKEDLIRIITYFNHLLDGS